jgi:Flp pilus assembly pilin Flp
MSDRALAPKIDLAPLRDEGQTMAEYSVVLGVLTLGVVVAIGLLSLAVTGALESVTSTIGDFAP